MQTSLSTLIRKIMVFILPNACTLKRSLPNGIRFQGPNKRGHGGRGVFIFGNDLEPEITFLPQILKPGDTFIDIGANTGIYSLNAALLVENTGSVYSFEPNTEMISCLKRSSMDNGFSNIHLRPVCLSHEFGVKEFWMNLGAPNSYSLKRSAPDTSSFSVLVMTLDQLDTVERFSSVAYIKIDAEGSEDEILAGARNLIGRCRPVIQMESIKQMPQRIPDYSAYRIADSCNIICFPIESEQRALTEGPNWSQVY